MNVGDSLTSASYGTSGSKNTTAAGEKTKTETGKTSSRNREGDIRTTNNRMAKLFIQNADVFLRLQGGTESLLNDLAGKLGQEREAYARLSDQYGTQEGVSPGQVAQAEEGGGGTGGTEDGGGTEEGGSTGPGNGNGNGNGKGGKKK